MVPLVVPSKRRPIADSGAKRLVVSDKLKEKAVHAGVPLEERCLAEREVQVPHPDEPLAEALRAHLKSEIDKWAKLIKAANIKAE